MEKIYHTWGNVKKIHTFLPGSRSGRLNLIKYHGFPRPVYLTANRPLWILDEIDDWLKNRPRYHAEAVSQG